MTRTTALKALYVARLAGILLAAFGADAAAHRGAPVLAIMLAMFATFLLLSGRVQAYFWAELLAGLHFLSQRDYVTSKTHTERFLEDLCRRPWLRHLIWLGTSSYSLSVEVMALNNLGAAEIELEHLDMARAHLERAIGLEPKCPLPYRNMFTLVMRTGSYAEAKLWLEKTRALGLKGGRTDRMSQSSQRRNAALSTTGVASSARPPVPISQQPVTGAYVLNVLNDDVTPLELVISSLE